MRLACILLTLFNLQACSVKSLLPPTLAVVGGGAGAAITAGSPAGAALGAGVGSAAGSLIVMDSNARQDKQMMVDALTSGDVDKLVETKLKAAKDGGFFDSILAEVYGVIKLCVIGLALWFIVPMVYSHWRAKKSEDRWNRI
jgi:hypothetical protein